MAKRTLKLNDHVLFDKYVPRSNSINDNHLCQIKVTYQSVMHPYLAWNVQSCHKNACVQEERRNLLSLGVLHQDSFQNNVESKMVPQIKIMPMTVQLLLILVFLSS